MSANFIKKWPCTKNAGELTVTPKCPIAKLFGQGINQRVVDQLFMWVEDNGGCSKIFAQGKYEPDGIWIISNEKSKHRDDNFAIRFLWSYSTDALDEVRIRGLFLSKARVEKLCLDAATNDDAKFFDLFSYFDTYGVVYEGCAIEINMLITSM